MAIRDDMIDAGARVVSAIIEGVPPEMAEAIAVGCFIEMLACREGGNVIFTDETETQFYQSAVAGKALQ
jgi:hypothetical protein